MDGKAKCPNCGNEQFENGIVVGWSTLKFKPDNASPVIKATILGGKDIRGKICTQCHFLMLFAADKITL